MKRKKDNIGKSPFFWNSYSLWVCNSVCVWIINFNKKVFLALKMSHEVLHQHTLSLLGLKEMVISMTNRDNKEF